MGTGIAPAETIPMIRTALNDEIWWVAIPIWSTAEKTSSYIFIVNCLFDHGTLNPRVKWNHFQPSFNRRVSLPLNVHMDFNIHNHVACVPFALQRCIPYALWPTRNEYLAMPIWSNPEQRRHPHPPTDSLWQRKMEEGRAEKEEVQAGVVMTYNDRPCRMWWSQHPHGSA